ncbi:exonuclease SbcC [Pectobacterium aquaticum]|uniref:exonuclease SbcC n=1 Tax=Pectobacterium aquaticum TaxID=2204145 RepID=UPI000E242FFE|nr:exonuclease SbcC [Pectobacterium aquaticum]UEM40636.1 exonuclease SbcC [Pectobacterium aquaticum]
MTSYLRIDRLILVGSRKNYSVSFEDGLNVIHGDSDTGKSSILEFVNYLLGSGNIELADEMLTSLEYAALELTINDEACTIVRNIFNPNELIDTYNCHFHDISNHVPKKFAPKFNSKPGPDGFFSDYLMDLLNFPKLKLKVSPTQDSSKFRRLSFRDLMRFCYVDQDDMGSKSLLHLTEWTRYAHVKEVFKYIFNVFDADISDLESQISDKNTQLNKLSKKYENVSDFLRETGYESVSSIDDEINSCDISLEEITEAINTLNQNMTSNSETYKELKAFHTEFNLKLKLTIKKLSELSTKQEQYIRLKNDYKNDISKIQAIHLANSKIGKINELKCNCPICDNVINIKDVDSLNRSKPEKLDEELSSLIRRVKSIEELIFSLADEQVVLNKVRVSLEEDLNKSASMIDTETKDMITPFLTQRDAFLKEANDLKNRRANLVSSLRIRNHQEEILNAQSRLKDNLIKLQDELERMRSEAPDITGVLSNLGDNLSEFLEHVNIKNRTGISIHSTTYSAVVRGRDYFKITSGGLRTLITIGYMTSILKYSIFNNINHPKFLLLDTVGKYLGKNTKQQYLSGTDAKEDVIEGTSDPKKYELVFSALIELCNLAENKKIPCQIIVVDNDVPTVLADWLKERTVAQYSSTGENGLLKGLIDDI